MNAGARAVSTIKYVRFASALCAALLAAPASAGMFDDDVARRAIAEQTKRVDEQSRRFDELKLQSESVAGRMSKIEEQLKNQPVLDLASQMELLRQEIKSLRGQLEVLSNSVEGSAKRQRDMYVDLDTRLRRFEQQPPPAPAPAAPAAPAAGAAAGGPVATAPTTTGATPEENQAYDAAQNQRRIGNYPAAITAFQQFIAQHPKSTLAPRAQYWIGDSYYNLRDFKSAIASQQKLLAMFPESSSVPDAMLNLASSQIELGDGSTARKTMDGLVARYPTSEAAEKARRRLATLK
jgi:tol-pal system protein YbgF